MWLQGITTRMVAAESTAWACSPALVREVLQCCSCRDPWTVLVLPAGPPAQLHLSLAAHQQFLKPAQAQ